MEKDKEEDDKDFVRNIYSIDVSLISDGVNIYFSGNGFMRYMIRFIVGTSIRVASGKENIDFIKERLNSSQREVVSYKAPAEGLYLEEVIY